MRQSPTSRANYADPFSFFFFTKCIKNLYSCYNSHNLSMIKNLTYIFKYLQAYAFKLVFIKKKTDIFFATRA